MYRTGEIAAVRPCSYPRTRMREPFCSVGNERWLFNDERRKKKERRLKTFLHYFYYLHFRIVITYYYLHVRCTLPIFHFRRAHRTIYCISCTRWMDSCNCYVTCIISAIHVALHARDYNLCAFHDVKRFCRRRRCRPKLGDTFPTTGASFDSRRRTYERALSAQRRGLSTVLSSIKRSLSLCAIMTIMTLAAFA